MLITGATLHITSIPENEEDMLTGVIPSTVFHSSLPYVLCKKHVGTNINTFETGNNYYLYPTHITTCTISDELLTLFIARNFAITIADNVALWGANIANTYSESSVIWYDTSTPDSGSIYQANPSSVNRYPAVQGSYSELVFYTINIDATNGYIPHIEYSSGTKIENGTFNINGKDLSSLCYLTDTPVNLIDTIATTYEGGHAIQFVNDTESSDGMALTSDSSGSSILKGSKTIFSSTDLGRIKYYGEVDGYLAYGSVTLNNTGGTTFRTITPTAQFQEGDLLIWSFSADGAFSSSSKISSSVVKYQPDTLLDRVVQLHYVGTFWIYTELYAGSSGELLLKFTYNVGNGTLKSQEYFFKFYIMR